MTTYDFYTDSIPANLVDADQWVNWRAEPDPNRPGKIRKTPKNARNGRNAQSTNPATWSTFETAVKRAGTGMGIGFCLDPDRVALIAIDLDHCIQDGHITPAAWRMVQMCNSYTEVTPSGEGLRIIMRGLLPAAHVDHAAGIEIYTAGRYITVTGDTLTATPGAINDAPPAFYAWYDDNHRRPQERPPAAQGRPHAPLQLDDAQLIERAQSAANGAKFTRLWTGDANGYASTSEADFALATLLAWWTQSDAGRVARLLCQSGLHRPKFDAVHSSTGETYAQLTARRACELVTDGYDPDHAAPPAPPEPDPDPGWATGPAPAPVASSWSPAPRPAPRLTRPGPIAASVATAVINEVDAVDFALITAYREKQLNGGDLAEQLFAPARKTAVQPRAPEWYSGEYPDHDGERTCQTHWRMRAENMRVVSAAPQPWNNWRGFTSKHAYVPACPHCQHERAMEFCRRIEKASELYQFGNMLHYVELSDAESAAAAARVRQRNGRKEDHISYSTFPIGDGRTILLHDAPYYIDDSTPLPKERPALFDLVKKWALATPVGKRAGHGLNVWGKVDAERAAGNGKRKPDGREGDAPHKWWIRGVNWGKVQVLLSAYLDAEIHPRGNKLDVDAAEILGALDAAGIPYEIGGDVPEGLSQLVDVTKKPSTNCDNLAQRRGAHVAAALDLERITDDIPWLDCR
jgi:putative DNA primase/helicase